MNLKSLGLSVLVFSSFQLQAKVSLAEKEGRIHFLERFAHVAPSVSVEAFKRELEYERQELPLEERAKNEARLIAEKIQNQIAIAYEKALAEYGDEERAVKIVTDAFESDLKLADPNLRQELLSLSKLSLENIRNGGSHNEISLPKIEKVLLPNVIERSQYLNEEVIDGLKPNEVFEKSEDFDDSEQLEFKSQEEFISNLVANRPSTRWVSTANQFISSGITVASEKNISYQMKIQYMGVSLEAGPKISFKRDFATNVNIMAEELSPILLPDGNFDTIKRDKEGKPKLKNGKIQRRFLAFTCEANLRFATDYSGGGGFNVGGVGVGGSVSQSYSNSVSLNSRRVLIPDYINNQTVTMSYLAKLCHKSFLNAQINDKLTVEKSLNLMMENIVASLEFSHPKTKCVVDTDCIDWFNNQVVYLWKLGTYPRCFEESREKYRACELRGLQGTGCKLYKNGVLVSAGSWEVDCDKGLKCVQYDDGGWFGFPKGKCQPVDPANYRDPKKYPEYRTVRDNNYLEVELVD